MSDVAFELRDAEIHHDGRRIIGPLEWSIPKARTTVLLGPAGTGKSVLLAALAGEPAPDFRLGGSWRRDVTTARVPQPARGSSSGWSPLLLDSAVSAVLLDEPPSASSCEHEAVASWIAGAKRDQRTVVLVTHDLRLARGVADHAALLVDGRVVESASADTFFTAPRSELAARFLRQGNCWPSEPTVSLPDHFKWIVQGALAGMGRPGLLRADEDDLTAIATAGVRVVVSLTERAMSADLLRAFGLSGRHFPIRDMGVPALGPTARLCAEIARSMETGAPVVVHCHAGLGRTGTILAATLVWRGAEPDEAIATIRGTRPGYVQTKAQQDFVSRFAEYCR